MPLSEPGFGPATFDGPLVVTPAPTDRFVVRQADGVVRVETRLQIYTAEPGEVFLFDHGLVGTPGWADITDPDTGGYWPDPDEFAITAGGVEAARFVEVAGNVQMILPSQNTPLAPTMAWGVVGAANVGLYSNGANFLRVAINNANHATFSIQYLLDGVTTNHPGLLKTPGTATVPNILSNRSELTTGIGRRGALFLNLIANNQDCIEVGGTGGVPLVGFYGTASIARQLGVAVTAAGIHAALVNLGLIT